jgi:hypothetical protein
MMTMAFRGVVCFSLAVSTGCLAADVQDPSTEDQGDGVSIERPHCVVEGVAVPHGAIAPAPAKTAQPRCFETFSDAIFTATKGRVRLPSSTTADEVDDQMLNGNAIHPESTFVIGIEYVDRDFGGITFTVQATFSCDSGQVAVSSLSPWGWNDKISSSRAFSNCNNSFHYEDDNFGGASANCGSSCAYIGDAMNDRTSSLIYSN